MKRYIFNWMILQFEILISFVDMQDLTFHLVEENKKNFVLGNLNSFIKSQMKTDPKIVDFHITSKYFDIDNLSKNVIVKTVIDLDSLCVSDSECCFKEICIIESKVVVQEYKQYKTTFLLRVDIKDINDNLPVFLNDKQIIPLSEKILVNTSISIEGAIDRDFSKSYQKKVYFFFDESFTFQLFVQQSDSETLSIIVMKSLDYELKQTYYCSLKVCDDTSNNCITKSIIIRVLDENDNDPKFEKKSYRVKILENYPIGKKILKVVAKDADSEAFNRTNYGFRNENFLTSSFNIDKESGVISLKENISIHKKKKYIFTVYAIDALSISFKKDFAEVIIDIEDINDNYPIISLLNGPMMDLYSIQIEENTPPKALFSIQVSDKDMGINAIVNCSLVIVADHLLEMMKVDVDIYQIRTVSSFDYEMIQSVEAEIVCSDFGTPSLTSKKVFSVNIIDSNEYEPQIKNNMIEVIMNENSPVNKFILNIEASDKDKGAIITYSLDEIGQRHFSINSNNGDIITTNTPIDKEKQDSIRFKVLVTDSLENPHTATATIVVFIKDQNDNAPQFNHTMPFLIQENQYVYTKLSTKIEAFDADKDEMNRSIMFRLLQTFNCRMEIVHEQIFDVNMKGEIETMAIIDREKDNNFTLRILAQDKGHPPISNSTNITIIVVDINDNPPVWSYPDSYLSSEPEAIINISKEISVGTVIAYLKAYDVDLDEAGKVGYLIISSDTYYRGGNFLILNETSGALTIVQYPLNYGKIHLRIRAYDHGTPQLYKDANLIINVILPNDNLFSGLNMAIIIGMLSITALISIFLVIAIFFIRRSPNPPRNHRLLNQNISKDCQNNLQSSYKDLGDFSEKKESVFTDNDCHHVYYRNGNIDANLPMYPQSSVEAVCPTYVRFATPGTFLHEMDGESADSGKGTSDLDVTHQSTLKASSANLYGNIQLIPSTRVNYFIPNKTIRRSYQVINEGEQTYNSNLFNQPTLSSNLTDPETIPNLCSYQTLSFNSLPPYDS